MADDVETPAESDRGIERLIFFTDAVVAIAITVLILPLVDIVTTDANKNIPVATVLADNYQQLFAFLLSFVIIARLWIANHEILANTSKATNVLMWADIAWALTIVVLPLPTELTAVYSSSLLTVGIYIANGFASTVLLAVMSGYLYRHPELQRRGHPISGEQVWGISSTSGAFVLAFILALVVPGLHYYALFILFLTWPLDAIVKPRIRKREAARNKSP